MADNTWSSSRIAVSVPPIAVLGHGPVGVHPRLTTPIGIGSIRSLTTSAPPTITESAVTVEPVILPEVSMLNSVLPLVSVRLKMFARPARAMIEIPPGW